MSSVFKIDRLQIENGLERKLLPYINKNAKSLELADNIYNIHNIPQSRIMDIISHRVGISECTPLELYALCEAADNHKLTEYFTDEAINGYTNLKLEEKPILEFPLVLKMIRVAEDQYIGSVDTDFLMKLKDAQLINYNPFAQRPRLLVKRNTQEYYKIQLNQKAVTEIKKALIEKRYVPNTITLNIPVNGNNDFRYDEKKNELRINKIDKFDISDGYHRYIAISQLKSENPDFDYPMELRIFNFLDDRVRTFIFQEDQKTKMRKIDSDSMNMSADANIVVERLNADTRFDLMKQIQRGGSGVIDYGELSSIIHYFYFKGKKIENPAPVRVQVQNDYIETFNSIVGREPERMNEKFSFKELCIIGYGIYNKYSLDEIMNALENKDNLIDKKFIYRTNLSKTTINETAKLYVGKEETNV